MFPSLYALKDHNLKKKGFSKEKRGIPLGFLKVPMDFADSINTENAADFVHMDSKVFIRPPALFL
jgi:hypothetical protein